MQPTLPLGVRKFVSVSGADDRVVTTGDVVEDGDDVVLCELHATRNVKVVIASADSDLTAERRAHRASFAGPPRRRGSRAPEPCAAALPAADSPHRALHPIRRRSGPR